MTREWLRRACTELTGARYGAAARAQAGVNRREGGAAQLEGDWRQATSGDAVDGGTIAVIPARAGSERTPGKNARLMAGRPMVAWTLEAALAARTLDRIVVSTDDEAVAATATAMGLAPPFRRPAELSGPQASVVDAVEHALQTVGGRWSLVVLLQPTSPLRLAEDIDGAVDLCRRSGAPAVLSTSPLAKPASFHAIVESGGRLSPEPPSLDGVHLINGAVYVARPEALFSARTFRLMGAHAFPMPVERGWDVDTPDEFAACEAQLRLRAAGGPT